MRRSISLLAALAASACAVRNAVPAPLPEIEDRARSAWAAALEADWDTAAREAAHLDRAWTGFRLRAAGDGALPGTLVEMDEAVASLEALSLRPPGAIRLARAADAATDPLDDLYTLYDAPELAVLVALETLCRSLILDARDLDVRAARLHADALERAWLMVRPDVVDVGAEAMALEVDAEIAALSVWVARGDAGGIARVPSQLLDRIGILRRLFPVVPVDPARRCRVDPFVRPGTRLSGPGPRRGG